MSADVSVGGGGFLQTSGSPSRLNFLGANVPFSIAQFVYHDAVDLERTYMNKYQAAGPLLRLMTSKAHLFCTDTGGAGKQAVGATTLSAGQWYHLGGAWDGSSVLRVLLNGVQDGTDTMTGYDVTNLTAADWCFGARASALNNVFDGRAEHIAVWNAYLSDAEWLSLARGVSPLRVRTASLKGYWPLHRAAASGNHAELSGGGAACQLVANANVAQGLVGSPSMPMMGTQLGGLIVAAAGGGGGAGTSETPLVVAGPHERRGRRYRAPKLVAA